MNAHDVTPFVGLRPFEEADSHLFFGRSDQTAALLERLGENRFVAVVGSSGCGKSSLVRAGLVPALRAGFLVRSRAAWRVLVTKPGKAPIRHLVQVSRGEGASDEEEIAEIEQEVRMIGAEPLLDRLREHPEAQGHNILLVVDQFEELFRFGLHEGNQALRDEAADFVAVLLALAEDRTLPVYVVLTMRADFIRDCDDVPDLPDALNRSLFLVPRLSREQFREAIEGPVRGAGATIANRLLDRLLNESSREHDELPVLQHALLRTWREWQASGEEGAIDAEHYERAGTVDRALDLDAEAALAGLGEEEIDRAVRPLLQALTAMDSSNRKIRRPARLSELEQITGLEGPRILALLDRFRADGRSLLVWPDGVHDPLIDISHESLIRNWRRLGRWTEEEAESITQYRRLAQAAADYPDRGGLWRDPKLQIGLDWRARCKPTRAWAERALPGTDLARAMEFLDESLRAREDALARRERERQEAQRVELERARREGRERLRRTRRLLAAAAACLIVVVAFAAYAVDQKSKAEGLQRRAETLQAYHSLVSRAWNELRVSPERSLLLASGALSLGLPVGEVPVSGAGDLSSADQVFLRALESSGGRPVATGAGALAALATAPDGRHLVTADGGGSLACWGLGEADDGAIDRRRIASAPGDVSALAAFPGRLLVGTADGEILGMSWPPGGCPTGVPELLATAKPPIGSLAVSPDGRWVAAGGGGALTLWRVDSTGRVRTAPALASEALAWALGGSADPWLAIGRKDGGVEVRSLGRDDRLGVAREIAPAGAPVKTLGARAGADRLLLVRVNGKATLFDLGGDSSAGAQGTALEVQEWIVAAAMAPDGRRMVTWNSEGGLGLWDLTGNAPRKVSNLPPTRDDGLRLGAFSTAGGWLVTGHSPSGGGAARWEVRRWRLGALDPAEESLELRLPPRRLETTIQRMAFSPDRTRALVLDKSGHLGLWSLCSRQSCPPGARAESGSWGAEAGGGDLGAAAFEGNDRLVLVRRTEGAEVVELDGRSRETPEPLDPVIWRADGRAPEGLAVSRDGRLVMTSDRSGALRVWDLARHEQVFSAELGRKVVDGAFSPDGRRLVTAGPHDGLRVHDLASGRAGAVIAESDALGILAVDMSPDGQRLITGGGDGTVRFWTLAADGAPAVRPLDLTIVAGREPVVAVAFGPDGEDALVATADGATRRWPVAWASRYRLARQIVGPAPALDELQTLGVADTSDEIFAVLLERRGDEAGSGRRDGDDTVAIASKERRAAPLERPE